jgi:hypothetical protein
MSDARGSGRDPSRARDRPLGSVPYRLFNVPSRNSTRRWPTASCARVALSADRNTHRPKRGHIRRALHRARCAAASPTSTPVTRFQPGGSPSSVEHVDVIGSSFPLRATAESSVTDLPPVSPPSASKGTPFELHVRKGAGRGFSGNTMFIRPCSSDPLLDTGIVRRKALRPCPGAWRTPARRGEAHRRRRHNGRHDARALRPGSLRTSRASGV